MKISIECPQCEGKGQLRRLEIKPGIAADCSYCEKSGTVLLENHLKVIVKPDELGRVVNYQSRMTKREKSKARKSIPTV